MILRSIIASAVFIVGMAIAPLANAADFDWNGTWSGRAANGRSTSIQISKGAVTSWRSNGQSQKIASSSVSKSKVSISHAEGAKVTLTPKSDGTVQYSWQGKGASSSAVLSKN